MALTAASTAVFAWGCPAYAPDQLGRLAVDAIDLFFLESHPVQVIAVVKGHLPDGCTRVHEYWHNRSGNVVNITVTTVRERESFCIQALQPVQQMVRIQGGFPPGDYIVRANGFERRFSI